MFPALGQHPTLQGLGQCAQCRVCGQPLARLGVVVDRPETWRCRKHAMVNPCAVEGCSHTRQAKGELFADWWLCRDHWRMACPPRSARRRVFLRFFATAKKLGLGQNDRWPEQLERRYWRYFQGLVARARRMARGDLDMTEINKLFGWD